MTTLASIHRGLTLQTTVTSSPTTLRTMPLPPQGYGNESRSESEHHCDKENIAPRIFDPVGEAFDILADILASQHLGEKVNGRYYGE